jgi:2-amino-4-hydroxy-6-hydroxymethyldihydropteridine diphosphokinase
MRAEGDRTAPAADLGSRVIAFIALGSNLDDPSAQLEGALQSLAALPRSRLVRVSSFYRNPPVGYADQPDFVNAAAMLETGLEPRELLARLLAIEHSRGRARSFANAPRTLDLDIALYGDRVVDEPDLTIPHPRLCERAFVLVPIAEIAPDALVPGSGRIADLARRVDGSMLVRLPGVAQP